MGSLFIELIKNAFTPLLILGMTWFVGQRILAYWEIKKKRKELDIATTTQFHQLYGEYKEVWRLWKVFKTKLNEEFTAPEHTRWELLKRATSAESKFEAIIVKMATERVLRLSEAKNLGLLRQGFQQLRESIRDGVSFDYNYKAPEYILFNELACEVAITISSDRKQELSEAVDASRNFINITNVRLRDWEEAVSKVNERPGKNLLSS
jgi:hypothetical protein